MLSCCPLLLSECYMFALYAPCIYVVRMYCALYVIPDPSAYFEADRSAYYEANYDDMYEGDVALIIPIPSTPTFLFPILT